MENLNRVELRGVVGSVRCQETAGKKVYHFTLATSRAYKDKNGQAVIETTWHQIVAWAGDNMKDLDKLDKGTKLYVSGRIRSQKFTGNDEVEKTVFEIVANRVIPVETDEPLQYEM